MPSSHLNTLMAECLLCIPDISSSELGPEKPSEVVRFDMLQVAMLCIPLYHLPYCYLTHALCRRTSRSPRERGEDERRISRTLLQPGLYLLIGLTRQMGVSIICIGLSAHFERVAIAMLDDLLTRQGCCFRDTYTRRGKCGQQRSCRSTDKFAKRGRYASMLQLGEDMCQCS